MAYVVTVPGRRAGSLRAQPASGFHGHRRVDDRGEIHAHSPREREGNQPADGTGEHTADPIRHTYGRCYLGPY